MDWNTDNRPHVVIVGGGFGGLKTAMRLKKTPVRVTLLDRHNYHLFQPLLYQVATGGLSPANIATPLRYILRRHRNCEVLLAEVTGIDLEHHKVLLLDGEVSFDYLVVAAGSKHSYFGHGEWETDAPGLKSIEDATYIRRKIFLAFEAAEREPEPDRRSALLTFVVVGGGPTGVELAGALSEIARHTLKHDFRHIEPENARIMLVEASEHVLAHYPPELSMKAAESIRRLGIEVHTKTKVTEIASDHVRLATEKGETTVPTATVLWAAGVEASPLGKCVAQACGVEQDRAGRVPVTHQLTVGEHPNVFVIGDLANCPDASGKPLPGLAPVAIQQGAYVARLIASQVEGNPIREPFQYVDRGSMATIGRAAAVAQIGSRQFCGIVAWMLWLFIHLMQIVQFQNRLLILMQWAWNYITFNRSSRIITGQEPLVIVNPPSKHQQ